MRDDSPVRRGQLIAPYGVGAMTVMKDGTSLICAGLDYWFKGVTFQYARNLDLNEFKVEEWRLQRRLRVSHLRLPPDYRQPRRGQASTNTNLRVPFLRFPLWHFCPRCHTLTRVSSTYSGYFPCPSCERKDGKRIRVTQVPIVAACDRGHLQDFPWREWAHSSPDPGCTKDLKLDNLGGAGLTSLLVKCDCGQRRTLRGVTGGDGETSILSHSLSDGSPYLCQGARPWLGGDYAQACDRPLRGSPRNATNVYFAKTVSAIYLPPAEAEVDERLLEALGQPPLSTILQFMSAQGSYDVGLLRQNGHGQLQPYGDDAIRKAIEYRAGHRPTEEGGVEAATSEAEEERNFRHEEFRVISRPQKKADLDIRAADITDYLVTGRYFSRINLLHRLRETRVLTGFTRLSPEEGAGDYVAKLEARRALMWAENPPYPERWLPAVKVYGEGIFLEFDADRLRTWETQSAVQERVEVLRQRNDRQTEGFQRDGEISPRFVLIHSFSHLLINQLTFTSGYSAASLRERLFVSELGTFKMAGLLIYTAAGDSEGTLGGLVRQGKPENFENVVAEALELAKWCSADPVCMEAGDSGGQGLGSLNLAACHSCSLLPETACEEFNRFLDRALVIGSHENPGLGYFTFDEAPT